MRAAKNANQDAIVELTFVQDYYMHRTSIIRTMFSFRRVLKRNLTV